MSGSPPDENWRECPLTAEGEIPGQNVKDAKRVRIEYSPAKPHHLVIIQISEKFVQSSPSLSFQISPIRSHLLIFLICKTCLNSLSIAETLKNLQTTSHLPVQSSCHQFHPTMMLLQLLITRFVQFLQQTEKRTFGFFIVYFTLFKTQRLQFNQLGWLTKSNKILYHV